MSELRRRLEEAEVDVALITDDDSVYYYTGYYDYLHMEFGRLTILVVPRDGESLLITPSMELKMAKSAAVVDRIEPWNDGLGDEWREHLPGVLSGAGRVGLQPEYMPPVVRAFVDAQVEAGRLFNLAVIVSGMRMIKSPAELQLARHAGQVAMPMMDAARATIGDGVPEYEVALATTAAGTRAAVALLAAHYQDLRMSPQMHFLQIMASSRGITMPHHRASTRIMKRGEPVFMCFSGMTNFHRFKLGFDRTFWIEEIADQSQAAVYQVAVDSQAAALEKLRPGALAQDIHAAYAEVIQGAGYDYPFRCGRATGFSFLETPQLVFGDKTELRPGMVLAVDGSVTDDGYEQITDHAKALDDVIIAET
jgi:Xaa-Pro dipeptidase